MEFSAPLFRENRRRLLAKHSLSILSSAFGFLCSEGLFNDMYGLYSLPLSFFWPLSSTVAPVVCSSEVLKRAVKCVLIWSRVIFSTAVHWLVSPWWHLKQNRGRKTNSRCQGVLKHKFYQNIQNEAAIKKKSFEKLFQFNMLHYRTLSYKFLMKIEFKSTKKKNKNTNKATTNWRVLSYWSEQVIYQDTKLIINAFNAYKLMQLFMKWGSER